MGTGSHPLSNEVLLLQEMINNRRKRLAKMSYAERVKFYRSEQARQRLRKKKKK